MSPGSVMEDGLTSSDPTAVREWLQQHHRKQLALLDRFLLELRLGRVRSSTVERQGLSMIQFSDRLMTTLRTVELLRHVIGSTRWRSPAQLLCLLKGLGREIHAAGGFREPAIGNIIRRVMAAVREEAANEEAADKGKAKKPEPSSGGRLSL